MNNESILKKYVAREINYILKNRYDTEKLTIFLKLAYKKGPLENPWRKKVFETQASVIKESLKALKLINKFIKVMKVMKNL